MKPIVTTDVFDHLPREINKTQTTIQEMSVSNIIAMVEAKIKRDGILLASTCDTHAHI